jgi:hypothetical protein
VSGTYYMMPHGNTPTTPIHGGTLQGGTVSPFLFTIFMEPLLWCLAVGSRGYRPTIHADQPTSTYMAYDDHGYADDINITTSTLESLYIQIKKLRLFSKYARL